MVVVILMLLTEMWISGKSARCEFCRHVIDIRVFPNSKCTSEGKTVLLQNPGKMSFDKLLLLFNSLIAVFAVIVFDHHGHRDFPKFGYNL